VVFGVRARQHDPIALQQIIALGMQVFVGDDVVVEALGLQPIDQRQIGVALPQARAGGAES
jgi:hypothetical protein